MRLKALAHPTVVEQIVIDATSYLATVPWVKSVILVGSSFYALLPSRLRLDEVSILPYPSNVFTGMYAEGTLFMAHVVNEGRIVYDDGYYEALERVPFKISAESVLTQWNMLKLRMALFDDLSIYGRVFVDCLSHLYSILKNVAIIALAMKGQFEFNKRKALSRFASEFPELKEDVNELCQLRSFYLIWHKSASIPQPFEPLNCREKTQVFLTRLRRIIEKVEENEFDVRN